MAKKKKHEEHENLERWLVSYSDFITLLFATFVVLYALSQVDIADFAKLEESIKQAFSSGKLEGDVGIMNESNNSIHDSISANSLIAPLMMEYMSPKYEQDSFENIQQSIEQMGKNGELEGVETEISDKGLLIRFKDDLLFKSASATLTDGAKKTLDKVGSLILQKFVLHYMRVEGHTDNQPIVSLIFPSNWELSSARSSAVIRYLIERFKFSPQLFTAVGYSDSRPIENNNSAKNRAANRRVEILILRNKYKNLENPQFDIMKLSKKEQDELQLQRAETLNKVKDLSEAAQKLTDGDKAAEESTLILKHEPEPTTTYDDMIKFSDEDKNIYETLDISDPSLRQRSNPNNARGR